MWHLFLNYFKLLVCHINTKVVSLSMRKSVLIVTSICSKLIVYGRYSIMTQFVLNVCR